MLGSFIGVFGKFSQTLNMVISAQLKSMRTNDAAFDRSVVNPMHDVFINFRDSFDDAVRKTKKKENEDLAIANIVVKHIVPTLDGILHLASNLLHSQTFPSHGTSDQRLHHTEAGF
jgi:hypothetical protein